MITKLGEEMTKEAYDAALTVLAPAIVGGTVGTARTYQLTDAEKDALRLYYGDSLDPNYAGRNALRGVMGGAAGGFIGSGAGALLGSIAGVPRFGALLGAAGGTALGTYGATQKYSPERAKALRRFAYQVVEGDKGNTEE